MTEINGGCACGAVRFSVSGPLMGMGVCYCTDCQKAAGGSPAYVGIAAKGSLQVTRGEPKVYISKGDSGQESGRAFCADCGSPLYSLLGPGLPITPVKMGALDSPPELPIAMQLYTDSAQSWHLMHEGAPQFAKAPPAPPV